MSGTVKVDGLKDAIKAFKQDEGDLNDLKDAFQAIGQMVANEAQSLAPVKTGKLRSGIKAARRQNMVVITSGGTFYHKFQHYGTKHVKANPYMYKAAANKEQAVIEAFETNVAQVLENNHG